MTDAATVTGPRHPAPWNRDVLRLVEDHCTAEFNRRGLAVGGFPLRVLDPFCGGGPNGGRIHELRDMLWPLPVETVGVEIEPEWVTSEWTIQGDASNLSGEWTGAFDVWASSITYANRMADHHDAQERCRECRGTGEVGVSEGDVYFAPGDPCPKCDGVGRRAYVRRTYRHFLGRPLHERNTGGMGWTGSEGDGYRDLHRLAYDEARRVLKVDGLMLVNVKNHLRAGVEQGVVEWHVGALGEAGFRLRSVQAVSATGVRHGANRELRTDDEFLICCRPADLL